MGKMSYYYFFYYFIILNFIWFVPILTNLSISTSLVTALATLLYLLSKSTKLKLIKTNYLVACIAILWSYKCMLCMLGESFVSHSFFLGVLNAMPGILVGSACLLVSVDRYFLLCITKNYKKLLYICVFSLILPICITYYLCREGSVLSMRSIVSAIGNDDLKVMYQSYGDFCVLLFCLVLPYIRSKFTQILLILLMSLSLIILGSKAAFAGILLSLILVTVISLIKKKKIVAILLIICISILSILFMYINKQSIYQNIPSEYHWVVNLFFYTTHERSFYTRRILETTNSLSRRERIVLGQYKHEEIVGLGKGTYTHNIMDYLDQFGVIFFIYIIGVYMYILFKTIFYSCYNKNKIWNVSLLLLSYCGILNIFVRSSQWIFTFFILGLCACILSHKDLFCSIKIAK